ncbi:hypothetical protein GCM10010343_70930 [Streptomyces avidinii]|nr:hypothetical protein GCM10010343_70930 [Streptomyces avidinii]
MSRVPVSRQATPPAGAPEIPLPVPPPSRRFFKFGNERLARSHPRNQGRAQGRGQPRDRH